MGFKDGQLSQDERLALLSLWTIPGIGPRALDTLAQGPGLASLLDVPPREWAASLIEAQTVLQRLAPVRALRTLGEQTRARAHDRGMEIAYFDEPAYPELLRKVGDAPPVLFYRGTPGPSRRRVALVGSRRPDTGFVHRARSFASKVASSGVGIVSGAAEGVDQACHRGALAAGGETWAFVGSALDQLDPSQARLLPEVLAGGGMFFSELPPGVRASKQSFPLRNRLVSGASDAVVILRATAISGCKYTAQAALRQRRKLLAMPGDAHNPAAWLCNHYIKEGYADACLSPEDVLEAVGLGNASPPPSSANEPKDLSRLSGDALQAYGVLPQEPTDFDDVLGATRLPAARLTSALCELELGGLVIQRPGKQYERI